jgi:HAD superfamily hydrolase (TIGR01509 family)
MKAGEKILARTQQGPDGELPVRGVIFDMDGLLLDTESLAMRALASAAADRGIDAPEAFCHQMIGVPADHCLKLVFQRFGAEFQASSYLADASRHMETLIERGSVKLKPGVMETLARLDALGIPRAIATSSSRTKAKRHLDSAGLSDRFETVVTRDDVDNGKPHPDLFECAAQKIGVVPGLCLSLEDSYNGVRAAHAAGTIVVMVPDLLPATDEMRSKCTMIAPNLHAVYPKIVRAE